MPVCHVVHQDESGHGELATEGMEITRGSPSWLPYYQVNISEEEETLQSINPKWKVCHWLQLTVQDIADEEVPCFKLVAPLRSGAEGTTLVLAKCLLTLWRWR